MMFAYTTTIAILSVIAGLFLALRGRKAEDVVYTKLDKIGRITNLLLLVGYVWLSPVYLFFGMISEAAHDGLLGLVGWIVSFINASAAVPVCIGLGLSVAWRKQGRSKDSFKVQFAGLIGIAFTVASYCIFAGNLLLSLN